MSWFQIIKTHVKSLCSAGGRMHVMDEDCSDATVLYCQCWRESIIPIKTKQKQPNNKENNNSSEKQPSPPTELQSFQVCGGSVFSFAASTWTGGLRELKVTGFSFCNCKGFFFPFFFFLIPWRTSVTCMLHAFGMLYWLVLSKYFVLLYKNFGIPVKKVWTVMNQHFWV